ncbi:DUF4747 family protein [Chromobacterium sp. Beijing]|uniref:DUF4747 family protein n=1 Tax=Chromobacterium sp. Beijing TaxID=2735795 RepID=UPI001F1EC263|nr:DUF4747 family protein [Chromobacterium sp. Beijing]UJB30298.1 DUF4747 family protein [Chromobacterium sp. Beijing]
MARDRSLRFARINIVTHPHTPAGYIDLMRTAFISGQSVAVRGDQHLMIGEMRYLNVDEPLQGLFGRLYRFIHIDKTAPWFNVAKNDVATKEEVAQINIPEHLRPNCEMFDFVFYPRGHAFYLETKAGQRSLSPGLATKMLRSLFAVPEVVNKFGQVDVNVFADKGQLDHILKIHQLRRLIIEVSKPNADELGRAHEKVFGRLGAMKARKLKMEIIAESKESIELDAQIKIAAQVAAAGNGKVVGYGYTPNGNRVEESTLAKSWEDNITYNPDLQTATDALVAATANLPGHD